MFGPRHSDSWLRTLGTREPIGHGHPEPGPPKKSGEELGRALAESWHRNVLAGNCRVNTFEEWLPIVAGGDIVAEIAAKARYAEILKESRNGI